MRLFAKSIHGSYNAMAEYKNGIFTVLKGSVITTTESKSIPKKAHTLRSDKALVTSKGKVLKDINFNSASAASGFVTGTSTNGLKIWRDSKGTKLKSIIE